MRRDQRLTQLGQGSLVVVFFVNDVLVSHFPRLSSRACISCTTTQTLLLAEIVLAWQGRLQSRGGRKRGVASVMRAVISDFAALRF